MTRGLAASVAALAALWLVAVPGSLAAQSDVRTTADSGAALRPLGLEEAVLEARRGNPDLRLAELDHESARAAARMAAAPLFPGLEVDVGFQRSNDPVFAFGTRLRQERFGAADLALDALNHPDPITSWSSGAGVRWDVLDPGAWARRAEARHGADAAGWRARRAGEGAELQARILYWRAVGADASVRAARSAEEAARATVERFRKRADEGLLTRADVLRAEAGLASARADRNQAERSRDDIRAQLGLALGWSPDTVPVPTDTLTAPESEAAPAAPAFEPTERADIRALGALVDMRGAKEDEALTSFAPRVEAFAGYQRYADALLGKDGDAWSVGVMLRWTVFAGLSRPAALSRARAERTSAELRFARSVREARAEVRSARRGVEASLRAVSATRAAEDAALQARDLMRRRFEEGLAGATDLLSAEAGASAARSRAVGALAGYHEALARWRFALGRDAAGDLPGSEGQR
ncbi:MAG TPA: TolC family protein [Gemmatimonadota bacterium]|nr:TolC family protein [Gemmatimonadota bacterium]